MKIKKWVDVRGFEGIYKICEDGSVMSVERYINHPIYGQQFVRERILTQTSATRGYKTVMLSKDGYSISHKVHRLLAIAFIPNPNNYPIVRHLNDNNTDNRIKNLAWGTCLDNSMDCKKNNKYRPPVGQRSSLYGKSYFKRKTGEKCHNSKIILDTQTGIYYFGAREASDCKCIPISTLNQRLAGRLKNNTGLIHV